MPQLSLTSITHATIDFTSKLSVPCIKLISCTEWQAAPLEKKKRKIANYVLKDCIQNYMNARE